MRLTDIKKPSDVKNLGIGVLNDLAKQIRQAMLGRLSAIGGHVGPNLGVVEPTLALFSVFDLEKDKIVYDVSHQYYAYKMLTGRVQTFVDPAHYGDIGEFSNPAESKYDTFYAGHTSPSISLSLGLAKARDIKKEKYNVIAFIGDGSLSGGEAFEGMDNVAQLNSNFIIVLNDNGMSIAENHGGIYKNLEALRKTNGTCDENLFRNFGLDYTYVADGNNVQELIEAFRKIKDIDHPIVVHIRTQKGMDYAPAEEFQEKFHECEAFQLSSGEPVEIPTKPSYNTITRDYLLDKIKQDPSVIVLTSATPSLFQFFEKERREAGSQYFDVGIAEQTGVAMSSGLAKNGAKPVYVVKGTFLQRAYDQLSQDLAMNNSPVVMPIFDCSVYGTKDVTHLGFWDIPFLSNIPNIVYLAPTNLEEFIAMMDWGLKQREHPVAIRVPSNGVFHATEQPDADYSRLNTFKMTKNGSKVAVIAAGSFYQRGEAVVAELEKEGCDPTLINPRFLTGVDEEMLESLKQDHELVVTLEDGSLEGGFGEKIARFYGPSGMKVLCCGLAKKFEDRYKVDELLKANNLEVPQIVASIKNILQP